MPGLRSPGVARHALDPSSLAAAGELVEQLLSGGAAALTAGTAAVGVEGAEALPLVAVGLAGATVAGSQMLSAGQPGFPKLFNAWFDGQISAQMVGAVKAARAAGLKQMEVSFPAVPNLEEVSFGTALNQQFQIQSANYLGMGDKANYMAVKRSPVDYANSYWARQLATSLGGGAVIASNTDLSNAKPAPGRVREVGLSARDLRIAQAETLIAVNPQGRWPAIDKMHDGPIVMLNTAFSEGYDLAGPIASYEQVYFIKRISKGWVYRCYPGPWEGYVERPDGSVQLIVTYDERPKLRTVAEAVRTFSYGKYGIFNDRYAKGFGGRL